LLTFLLIIIGLLLLLLSLAGVALGVFMALDERTRTSGLFFAIWCVPAVAASAGILMRDSVTFTIGAACFVVAGVALVVEHLGSQKTTRARRTNSGRTRKRSLYDDAKRWVSER